MLQMCNLWRQKGLGLDGSDQITAYAAVDLADLVETRVAIAYFGGVLAGLALPQYAVGANMIECDWTLPWPWLVRRWSPWNTPNRANGHAVALTAYDAGHVGAVTWGVRKPATWGFLRAYQMVGIVALSVEDWLSQGRAPSGLDVEALHRLLQEITK
jgi:hypothetical protein